MSTNLEYPSPEGVACVPASKPKAHDHQYRQHKTWDTHATCEICGITVSKETILSYPNVFDRQLSPELLKERRAIGVSAPSPAEPVPLEATPSSTSPGLDSSSADVPPVETPLVPEAPFRDFHVQCQGRCDFTYPAFAISPKKGEPPCMVIASEEAAIYVTKEQCEAFFGNSHIAKIQALTEATKDLSQIIAHIMNGGDAYLKDAKYREAINYGMDAARAALALPSA